jgi:2-hydroxycyclohexanecarboxyl-CoA dehydrogenase
MNGKSHLVRPLADSAVWITGGTSGIGLASAIRFAQSGVRKLALIGRNAERGELARQKVLAAASGIQVEFISADLNDLPQAVAAAGEAHRRLGAVDVLVCSTAGNFTPLPLHEIAVEDIQPMLLCVALAPMLMSRLVLPWMRAQDGGVIINIASDAAKVPTPGETILGGGMAAIVLFSRTLAIEAKRYGVRVNVLTPSLVVGTPTGDLALGAAFSAKLFARAITLADLGLTVPEDLAELIVFLASPQAARITGQTISVNGGISAG